MLLLLLQDDCGPLKFKVGLRQEDTVLTIVIRYTTDDFDFIYGEMAKVTCQPALEEGELEVRYG